MNKILVGEVVSTKMTKTVVVAVERKFQHPTYKKVIVRHRKFKAHCDQFKLKVGDKVKIKETRPFSKETHFLVVEKLGA
jgi:small subunit ribosomal protein S17